jgi:tetratricopeptide (TPR) repeat protein
VERQEEMAREAGYRLGECISILNRGSILRVLGRTQEAVATGRHALERVREISERRVEGYALHELALSLEQAGEPDRAEAMLEEALALREKIRYLPGIASTCSELGRLRAEAGRADEARKGLERAVSVATEVGDPELLVPALVRAADLAGGDMERARKAWREHGSRLPHVDRMEAAFRLGRATGDATLLGLARRMLEALAGNAPPACRESVRQAVPLHRAIREAGGSGE